MNRIPLKRKTKRLESDEKKKQCYVFLQIFEGFTDLIFDCFLRNIQQKCYLFVALLPLTAQVKNLTAPWR